MRALLVLLVFCATALAGPSALAAGDPRKAEADALFAEGKALYERESFDEALDKLDESYRVYPSPNTLVAIARVEQLLGRNVAATRHLREALKQPLLSPNNVPAARQRLAELEALVGRVEVQGPAGMKVSVGDLEARLPLEEPIDVEPGLVTARGELEGREYEASVESRAGEVVTMTFAPTSAEVAAMHVAPPAEPEASWWTTRRTLGVVVGGLAVVAAGVGGGFLAKAEGHVSDGNRIERATPEPCADVSSAACSDYQAAFDGFESSQKTAMISFIGAGALAVTSVALLFWPDGRKETARKGARMRVAPTVGGLSLTGTF